MENKKISVKNLKKNFGSLEVLRHISLDVAEGEVVCLIGPSGSGKSTFLRCLNRLETITAGEVVVDGITTNLDFQYDILNHPVFLSGNVNTHFIPEYFE